MLLGGSGERTERGQDGALYEWRVAIAPLRRATASRPSGTVDPAVTNSVRLYRLDVEESWAERGHRRTFRLRSERVFVGPPGAA